MSFPILMSFSKESEAGNSWWVVKPGFTRSAGLPDAGVWALSPFSILKPELQSYLFCHNRTLKRQYFSKEICNLCSCNHLCFWKWTFNIGKPEHGSFENLASVVGIHWFFFIFLTSQQPRSLSQGLPKSLSTVAQKTSVFSTEAFSGPDGLCSHLLISVMAAVMSYFLTNQGDRGTVPKDPRVSAFLQRST